MFVVSVVTFFFPFVSPSSCIFLSILCPGQLSYHTLYMCQTGNVLVPVFVSVSGMCVIYVVCKVCVCGCRGEEWSCVVVRITLCAVGCVLSSCASMTFRSDVL